MSGSVATEPTEAPDDIKSALSAAFDEHQPREAPREREAAELEASSQGEAASPPTDTAQERARDAQGRFAKAEATEAAVTEQAAPETQEKPAEAAKPDLDAETQRATARWSAADKDMLAKQPAEVRDFLLRRARETEADYSRKMIEVTEKRREFEPILQLFEPHKDAMAQRGLTPASAIQAWYNVERGLMEGGQRAVGLVADIVRGYKIDPAHLAQALGIQGGQQAPAEEQQQQQQFVPPHVLNELNALKQGFYTLQTQEQQRQQMAQQQAAQQVMSEIDQFRSATDSAGHLAHPYFGDVEDDMYSLAVADKASGKQPVLSDLYERAVWSNPSIRDRMLADQRAADEAQRAAENKRREEEARAKAEKARRAASSVTGAPGSGQSGRARGDSLRDALEDAAERVSEAA